MSFLTEFMAPRNAERGFVCTTSHYLMDAVNDIEAITEGIFDNLATHFPEADTLIGTGLSGALVVPHVGRELDMFWALVRKKNDGSHAANSVEGTVGERWVFVDDLIDTGATLRRTKKSLDYDMENVWGFTTELCGAILYDCGAQAYDMTRLDSYLKRKD